MLPPKKSARPTGEPQTGPPAARATVGQVDGVGREVVAHSSNKHTLTHNSMLVRIRDIMPTNAIP